MNKEFEEELFAPVCELHFACDRPLDRVSTQDIESHPSNDREILWRIVLARSRIVLVEDDVELPMEVVFDAPVSPRRFEHVSGRQTFGEDDVACRSFDLATPALALGLDASQGGQAREAGRVGRTRDHADPSL